jgi:two-component system, OmpR family, phosphate regulon sensor histidine kinase PhoR
MSDETSQNILRAVLDTSRECILVVDRSMRIALANRVAADVFGGRAAQLEGRRLTEIIRDPVLHDAFRTVFREERESELKIELMGTERRSFDVHVGAIRLGSELNAIGAFYDITKLERLERVRQEFLSNISHELRTPLTSIMAYVETLEDGAIDDHENNRRFLGVIRRNAERMHALIADVAELSQIESGNITLDVKNVRVAPLVDETFAALRTKASVRNIELINEVTPDTMVRADSMRLEQMLTNLIDNAIKFNREGGSVTVSVSKNGTRSIVSIADTGDGIMAENLKRIFERFYRIDRGRSREVGGTGLGLAIVKHIARLHGGDVSAVSTPGQGATFAIELPTE